MELVRGVTFVEYVRGDRRNSLSIERLKFALRQLVEGVSALHRLGKLHRDIKPSNVLVTREGRVVILDFGLITELLPDYLGGAEHVIGGTPAYVSPEEGSGMPPSEAGDWVRGGRHPVRSADRGDPLPWSTDRRAPAQEGTRPPSPSELVPDVPADLGAVCAGADVSRSGATIVGSRRDQQTRSRSVVAATVFCQAPPVEAPFVGRAGARGSRRRIPDGHTEPRLSRMCGPSGIGKTALVRSSRPSDDTRSRGRLSGRCYEHESVPHKALDGVVDSLSHYMATLAETMAESLLPHDVVALRLFPVMLRIPAIAKACREREPATTEPFMLRRLAFEALRELLVSIAVGRRVVIFIDDLQWADVDGVGLLEELLRPPGAPALLTVVSFRSEEVAGAISSQAA